MNNGWIKLHRSVLQNKIFRHDITAWHVFEVLLLMVDKKTAEWSGGRYQLALMCEQKPTTTYQALKRLENANMVTLVSNNKYTSITICKWKEYQGDGDTKRKQLSDIKVTSNGHQSDTLTRIENRELRNIPTVYGKPELNELFEYWEQTTGIPIISKIKANRNACNNLFKKHGLISVKKLIDGVVQSQNDKYAPRISDFCSLQSKLNELMVWGKKNQTTKKGTIKI